jgi:hypothetical protein
MAEGLPKCLNRGTSQSEKLEPGILNPSFRILLVNKAGVRLQDKPNVVSKVLSIGVRVLENFGVAILIK